jgi:ribosomal protein S18 acetylase RimI-like enzyme
MRVRRAEPADAAGIALVHVRAWQVAYRGLMPQEYLDALDPVERRGAWETGLVTRTRWPWSGTLVVDGTDGIVGFVQLGPSRDEDAGSGVGEVAAVYALSTVWGTGVGRALMDAALASLTAAGYAQATLWVLDTNVRARRFYEAAGWRLDGAVKVDETRGFPLSELRYRRPLAPPPVAEIPYRSNNQMS